MRKYIKFLMMFILVFLMLGVPNVSFSATKWDILYGGWTSLSTVGPTDNLDASGTDVLYVDTGSNNVTIGGFIGGVQGQTLKIAITDKTNNVTLEHNEGTGNQNIFLSSGTDETITAGYGGWNLVCDGTNWYENTIGSSLAVKNNNVQVGNADIEILDFSSNFGIAESPDKEIQITLNAALASISGLTEADVSILEATADNAYNVVTSGGNNYIFGSNAGNTALEFKTPANIVTLVGLDSFTGTGDFVKATSPTLITPVLGAATATSIAVNASATPTVNFNDSDQDDTDVTAAIYANATTTGTGAEVADMFFQAQGAQGTAGTLETFAHWDGSEETLTLTGDVTVTGDATATSLTVARSATPGFIFQDSDCTDSDDNAHIYADATATGAGVEVIDLYFRAQGAGGTPGAMDTFMFWDGSEENLTLDCNLQVVRNTNATKTDSYVVLAADLGKTLIMNSASDKIFTTPSVAAGDIGAHLKFIKIGTGMLTIQMADSDTVGDSGAGDTVYCGGTGKAVIVLELVTATGWAIMSVVNEPSESWITTD